MFTALISTLIFAQAAASVAPPTLEEDRLRSCMGEARSNPATAITTASEWLEGSMNEARSAPQQCLGFAYMSLLRWDAAEAAFVAARDARIGGNEQARARLGAMAGNAALAGGNAQEALIHFQGAQADAAASGLPALAGQVASDRARALVALGRPEDAANALVEAREADPQEAGHWLLSATLGRRMEDIESAQNWIETAALLDPSDPAIGLEAGVIAAMGGFDEAARASWQSVIDTAPNSPQAPRAAAYLQQFRDALQAGMPEAETPQAQVTPSR